MAGPVIESEFWETSPRDPLERGVVFLDGTEKRQLGGGL